MKQVSAKTRAFWTALRAEGAYQAYTSVLHWLDRFPIDDVRRRIVEKQRELNEALAERRKDGQKR